jgi:hypothetical protein
MGRDADAPVRERTEASTRLLVAAKAGVSASWRHVRQLEVELAGRRGKLYERL